MASVPNSLLVLLALQVHRHEPRHRAVQAAGRDGLSQRDHRQRIGERTEVAHRQVAHDQDLDREVGPARQHAAGQQEARSADLAPGGTHPGNRVDGRGAGRMRQRRRPGLRAVDLQGRAHVQLVNGGATAADAPTRSVTGVAENSCSSCRVFVSRLKSSQIR